MVASSLQLKPLAFSEASVPQVCSQGRVVGAAGITAGTRGGHGVTRASLCRVPCGGRARRQAPACGAGVQGVLTRMILRSDTNCRGCYTVVAGQRSQVAKQSVIQPCFSCCCCCCQQHHSNRSRDGNPLPDTSHLFVIVNVAKKVVRDEADGAVNTSSSCLVALPRSARARTHPHARATHEYDTPAPKIARFSPLIRSMRVKERARAHAHTHTRTNTRTWTC